MEAELSCAMVNYMKLSEGNSEFPEIDIMAMTAAEAQHTSSNDGWHSSNEWSSWSNAGWSWDDHSSWNAYWRKKERTLPENTTERFLSDEGFSGLG